MRAFKLLLAPLATLAVGAAIFTATAPAYAAVSGSTSHPADACPLTSHWDNILNECVPN